MNGYFGIIFYVTDKGMLFFSTMKSIVEYSYENLF